MDDDNNNTWQRELRKISEDKNILDEFSKLDFDAFLRFDNSKLPTRNVRNLMEDLQYKYWLHEILLKTNDHDQLEKIEKAASNFDDLGRATKNKQNQGVWHVIEFLKEILELNEDTVAKRFATLKFSSIDALKNEKTNEFPKLIEQWNQLKKLATSFVPFPKCSEIFNKRELDEFIKIIDTYVGYLNNPKSDIDNTEVGLICAEYDIKSKSWRIGLDTERYANLLKISNPQKTSQTVAFIGKTHAGKSTLIHTLQSSLTVPSPVLGGPSANFAGTSSDIHVFNANLGDKEVRLIDVEGGNGTGLPLMARFSSWFQSLSVDEQNSGDISKSRNEFIANKFPRFCYLTSDVVVYVSEMNWFNGKFYYDEAMGFAESCIKNLSSALPPSLILIQNKATIEKSDTSRPNIDHFNSEVLTREFLKTFDTERRLELLFHNVRCITIPRRDDPQFKQQIDQLKVCLSDFLAEQVKMKVQKACKLSELEWCGLTAYVAENFTDENLSIAKYIADKKISDDFASKIAWKTFKEATRKFKSNNEFEELCKTTISVFALVTALEVKGTWHPEPKENASASVYSNERADNFSSEFIAQLWEKKKSHIDNLRDNFLLPFSPCAAQTTTRNGKIISCEITKADHAKYHRGTDRGVFFASSVVWDSPPHYQQPNSLQNLNLAGANQFHYWMNKASDYIYLLTAMTKLPKDESTCSICQIRPIYYACENCHNFMCEICLEVIQKHHPTHVKITAKDTCPLFVVDTQVGTGTCLRCLNKIKKPLIAFVDPSVSKRILEDLKTQGITVDTEITISITPPKIKTLQKFFLLEVSDKIAFCNFIYSESQQKEVLLDLILTSQNFFKTNQERNKAALLGIGAIFGRIGIGSSTYLFLLGFASLPIAATLFSISALSVVVMAYFMDRNYLFAKNTRTNHMLAAFIIKEHFNIKATPKMKALFGDIDKYDNSDSLWRDSIYEEIKSHLGEDQREFVSNGICKCLKKQPSQMSYHMILEILHKKLPVKEQEESYEGFCPICCPKEREEMLKIKAAKKGLLLSVIEVLKSSTKKDN